MSLTELRKALKSEKVVYGIRETVKNLKNGKTKKIFLSSNCPEEIKGDILYYSKIANVEVSQLEIPSDEISLICKRAHSISVISY